MTDEKKPKKQIVTPESYESDAQVTVISTEDFSAKGEETSDSEKLKDPILNETLNSDIFHDGFIEMQGDDSVRIKLDRPMQVSDYVVLLKDFADFNLYKGYLCQITEVVQYSKDPNQCQYHVIFDSDFADDDPSLKSSRKDFEFIQTEEHIYLSGKDLIRLEIQDLRFRTYFN